MKPTAHFRRLHFVGLGGSGMSVLAEVMVGFGFAVSGSDAKESEALNHLRNIGVTTFAGHSASQVGEVDALIFSAAIPPTNPEIQAARQRKLPILRRAELLGLLTGRHHSLAVAGTHGKSTTTAMLGRIYRAAGLDPTIIGGAASRGENITAVAGQSDRLIAEADEYDRAFLVLHPTSAIITNVDSDHLDCYGTESALHLAFEEFLMRLPAFGLAVLHQDDPVLQGIRTRLPRRTATFGEASTADYYPTQVQLHPDSSMSFVLSGIQKTYGEIRLQVFGRHNLRNALAAAAMALEEEVPFSAVVAGLEGFPGVKRRLERIGSEREVVLYDDYAHHPTEVKAALLALRPLTKGKLIAIFQPHLFSRTQQHAHAFGEALALADQVYVTKVFASREAPIPGIEGDLLVASANVQKPGVANYLTSWNDSAAQITATLQSGDVVVTLGAGDIHLLGPSLLAGLK